MKIKEPSITDIKKILGTKDICGYNDKRKNGRRIKITSTISHDDQALIEAALSLAYPQYTVAVGNFIAKPNWGKPYVATAIHFRTK